MMWQSRWALLVLTILSSAACTLTARLLEPGEATDADLAIVPRDADLDAPQDEETVGPPPALACGESDENTLALYTFEEESLTEIRDHASSHHGELVGTSYEYVDGPSGCGKAIRWGPQDDDIVDTYAVVVDSTDWHISEGSIDLWVRFESTTIAADTQGIISRDEEERRTSGHFSIMRKYPEDLLIARLQRGGESFAVCAGPLEHNRWYHVGVNFGSQGLDLYIDGTLDEFITETFDLMVCGRGELVGGLEGNNNPWLLGASASFSAPGSATPAVSPFDGSIDDLRISNRPRLFSRD